MRIFWADQWVSPLHNAVPQTFSRGAPIQYTTKPIPFFLRRLTPLYRPWWTIQLHVATRASSVTECYKKTLTRLVYAQCLARSVGLLPHRFTFYGWPVGLGSPLVRMSRPQKKMSFHFYDFLWFSWVPYLRSHYCCLVCILISSLRKIRSLQILPLLIKSVIQYKCKDWLLTAFAPKSKVRL